MLTTIHITVRDRVPTITAGEDVISHNSDYVAEFEFDEEWQDKVKTVYFVCEDGNYQAVVMSGNSCGVPMLDGEHRRIFVGVQEGTVEKPSVLKTTRPCCLKVKDSIADYLGQPIPDPTPDVYEQIIAMLESITSPTWDSLQDKPFSTLGSGLVVDENGVLSAQGGSGGSANAVQYVAQELTDEQKKQARSNIDAGKKRIVVEARRSSGGSTMVYYNVDDQNAAIDKFIAEYKAGTEILLRLYNRDYPLTNIDEDGIVYFAGYIYDAANKSVGVVTYKMEKNKAVVEESSLYGIRAISLDDQLKSKGYAADAKAVGDRLDSLSEAKVDKSALGLIVGADGKIYVAINGVAIGSGVEITGGTGEDTTYKVELSDGIILTTLMFQDEFDGDRLSSTWKPTYGYDNAALNNWWTADEKNLGVSNGCVRLTMLRDNPTDAFAISAAKIETMQYGAANNYGFDTGYCEVRFKLDKVGVGIWPAIWYVGQTHTDEYTDITDTSVTRKVHGYTWPWAGEIDQLDGIGSAFTPGLIYQTDPYDRGLLTMKGSQNVSLDADTWYTIGLYKTKDVIKVYWNRVLIDTFDISAINSFSGMGERLIINLTTGKSLGGILPDDVSEVNMFVDYVRVYSLSNDYTTLAEQNTATLLPDYADGFDCVSGRNFLLRPQFAENTKNTALYWTSSDTAVAKVENGYVTTVANGECTISATDADGNKVISFPMTVKDNAGILATAIKITTVDTDIDMGGTLDIEAHIYPTNCDSLTPTLSVVSGSEYCTINGLTIMNTNTSGANQDVIVRVGTNNPNVYEDVTLQVVGGIVDNIDTNGIVAKYTRNGWSKTAWASDIDSNPPLTTANSTSEGWVYTAGAGYMKDYGAGTAVNIGTDLFNIDGPFTILSRMYYAPGANISGGGNVIEVINDGGTNAGNIEVNAGQNRIYTKDASSTNRQINSFFGETSRDTTNGATYDITIVKDESRNLTVYINGIQTAQSTHYASVDPMGLTGMALIWPKNSVSVAHYQALLAYNRALTATEIVTLHTALEEMYA